MPSARFSAAKLLANRFLRVLPRSSYNRLIVRTPLYLKARMSASTKAPEGLKDSECKKGNLGVCPPIPYVPPTDLLQTKENADTLKLKLPNGTVFSMTIIAKANPDDYLQHLIVVQCLIVQKGLDAACKKAATELEKAKKSLEAQTRNPSGSQDSSSKEDQEACKLELKLTKELVKSSQKDYDGAIAQAYELLRNLFVGDPQAQWDWICREMHKRDSWATLKG